MVTDTPPVGAVGGYDGRECGGSFILDVTDSPHSSKCAQT
nr:hypothetical protein [Tanacetum cinerariifolium]